MKINEKTLKVLEWEKILEKLSKQATSEIGKLRCLNAEIFSDINLIQRELSQTSEAKLLLDHSIFPPFGGIRNIGEFIEAAKAQKTLRNTELIDIANTIGASRRLKSFFGRYKEEAPLLFEITVDLFENKALEEEILDIFDDAGNMIDSASPELKRLRASLKDKTHNLKTKLNSIIHSSSISKYLQDTVYTQRDDRYVLPVKAEYKNLVQGIIHDSSSSGATFFIEPKAIVELNNSIRETELNIEHEIARILTQLSLKVTEHAELIFYSLAILADIDFIFAKAKYSILLKATEPKLNSEKFVSLSNAKHPILLTVIEKVVPNNIELGKNWNTMIITGSNTGGKTIVLKTLGLFTLMTKAGMHVPAEEANIYPFKNIFADIGDEQSVIQSLSTFSGHMNNIINLLNKVDDDSLVLLDEVGAGTDPSEGSALAQAILENLYKKGARTIVTTHYGELKSLAYTQQGFYNASVEFDIDSLSPTYKLLMGIPGTSNAITISANLGLSAEVVQNAKTIYKSQKDNTGEVLQGLQDTQQELSRNVSKAESTKEELEKLEKDYTEKIEKIKIEKKQAINIYKKKFESELANAKDEIRSILDEVRRTKSEKIARRSYNRLNEVESHLRNLSNEKQEELEPQYIPIIWENAKVGDTVFVKDLEQTAILLSLPDKNTNVQVEIGFLKTSTKAKNIVKSDKNYVPKKEKQKFKSSHKGFSFSRSNVSNSLDLRGTMVNDGLDKVDFYLDEASLANLSPVTIIHGHGTGALRDAIRKYLAHSPYVAKFRPGDRVEGGDGVSIVDLV